MCRFLSASLMAIAVAISVNTFPAAALGADEYDYDLVHSSVSFKARHLDISWIHG